MDSLRDGRNWYSYCHNNPLKYYDPDGQLALTTTMFVYFAVTLTLVAVADYNRKTDGALAEAVRESLNQTADFVHDLATSMGDKSKSKSKSKAKDIPKPGEGSGNDDDDDNKSNEPKVGEKPDPNKTYQDKKGNQYKFKPKKNWDGKSNRQGQFEDKSGNQWSKSTNHKGTHKTVHHDITLPNGQHVTVTEIITQ